MINIYEGYHRFYRFRLQRMLEIYADGKYLVTVKGDKVPDANSIYSHSLKKNVNVSNFIKLRFLSLPGDKHRLELDFIKVKAVAGMLDGVVLLHKQFFK